MAPKPKKYCTTPGCKRAVGHIGNCTGKEALSVTRRGALIVQKNTFPRPRPRGPAPRDKETNVQKIWDPRTGKWITPVFEDVTIIAHSLMAMASPVSETNVAQATHVFEANVPPLVPPQTQINVYAQPQVVAPAPQVVAHAIIPQLSIASLLYQLGVQINARDVQINALESRVSAIETARDRI